MTTMNSRARVRCVLEGRLPDRVPFNFWMDRSPVEIFDRQWGHDFRIRRFGTDVVEAFVRPYWWAGLAAAMQDHPSADPLEQALHIPLPDPADPGILADILHKRARYPDQAVFALVQTPWETLLHLRTLEQLGMDLYDRADLLCALLDRLQPRYLDIIRRVCATDVDALYLAGDVCSRDGAMFAPLHLRTFMLNYVRDALTLAHEAGKKVFYHTDGKVLEVLDLLLEYGFDGINPLEPRLNDAAEFVRKTQGRLMVYGGLDNAATIPLGTPEEVTQHVSRQFALLGAQGRLIFSCHDIPGRCPPENLDAMVTAIKACRYAS